MAVRLLTQRSVIRENYDRVDRQVVLFIQPSEVGEHALWEVGLRPGLIFNMDEEEGFLSLEASLHQ